MAKLYPPYIGEVLPAFTGNKITVPFQMNRAVSIGEIGGFYLILRDLQGKEITNILLDKIDRQFETFELEFFLTDNILLKIGQFYKIQIGYKDLEGNLGHLSTTGVIKYTNNPTVYIENLSEGTNMYTNKYIGVYIPPEEDKNEKLYSGWLEIYDTNYNLIKKTKEVIYNSLIQQDQEYTIHFENELGILENNYYMYFIARSVNNIISKSAGYFIEIKNQATSTTLKKFIMNASLNREEGYIDISINTNFDSTNTNVDTEYFTLLRKEKENDEWRELKKFELIVNATKNISFSLKDYLVEQGKTYSYGIQQYNQKGIRSIIQNIGEPIYVDFEHIFLYDGEKQLKIKYNPQISSFKTTRQEQKQDTLGSQYPTIFRNNILKYKEFTINGLISWTLDDERVFLGNKYEDILNCTNKFNEKVPCDLNSIGLANNMRIEREFKLMIEEWLSNGKPKLFKSAQEGNYIVYLTGVSLTPNEQLGRMLHSFSATVYEIDSYNYFNCLKYNFLPEYNTSYKINPDDQISGYNFNTIKLYDLPKNLCTNETENIYTLNLSNKQNHYLKLKYFEFTGMTPGDVIILDGVPRVINYTGSYTSSIIPKIVQIKPSTNQKGLFYYSYYATSLSSFNQLVATELHRTRINQLTWREIELFNEQFIQTITSENSLKTLDQILFTPKWNLNELYSLRFFKREIIKVYNKKDIIAKTTNYELSDFDLYYDSKYTQPLDTKKVNKWYLYHICNIKDTSKKLYIDGASFLIYNIQSEDSIFSAKLPYGNDIDLSIIGSYELESTQIKLFSTQKQNWENIQIGIGVICDLVFSQIIKTSSCEENTVFIDSKRQVDFYKKLLQKSYSLNTTTKARYNIEEKLVKSYLYYLKIYEEEIKKEEAEDVPNE